MPQYALLCGAVSPALKLLGLPALPPPQRAAWSRATTAFALFQALGGYGYSFLFSHTHNDYALIFICGAAALGIAFIADLVVSRIGAARAVSA
ncbi:hypothetical protein LMG28614_00406 [Paraburkholderia ultramafica]|uniref:Uncharacterized protein n=1 Tax=Paraburkholderia ultramafica TaxID=1544867 RepID=A0A6S7ATM7_9BURK|nr:hypothetical protein LMG28614_00406 [Paraburkholderia ultramafica]